MYVGCGWSTMHDDGMSNWKYDRGCCGQTKLVGSLFLGKETKIQGRTQVIFSSESPS
jgi:hypothetical protein